MKPTKEMIEAEKERQEFLRVNPDLIDCVRRSRHINCSPQDDPMLEMAIKELMIASHAGRIGL